MCESQHINSPTEHTEEEQIVFHLRCCAKLLRHHTEGRGSQRRVLLLLYRHGPMTQRDLLDLLGIRASSLSELLGKLEAKEYIAKEKSKTDKRNYNVSLTESGLQALEEMQLQYRAAMTDLLSGFNAEETAQLSTLLDKLHGLWKERAAAAPSPRHDRKEQDHLCGAE